MNSATNASSSQKFVFFVILQDLAQLIDMTKSHENFQELKRKKEVREM